MGMTIEKIIATLDYIKHVGNGESEYKHCREEIALNEAVTIMRKYQKIVEIAKSWNDMNSFDSMLQISEVVKDEAN